MHTLSSVRYDGRPLTSRGLCVGAPWAAGAGSALFLAGAGASRGGAC